MWFEDILIILIVSVLWLYLLTIIRNGDLIVKNRLRMISKELRDSVNRKRTPKKNEKTGNYRRAEPHVQTQKEKENPEESSQSLLYLFP